MPSSSTAFATPSTSTRKRGDHATVRKLDPEEVKTIENKGKGPRRLIEEEYDAFLSDYEVGDYGEASWARRRSV
jgi:hypothetical protein